MSSSNLFVDPVSGEREEKDKYEDSGDIRCSCDHDHREDCKQRNQDQESRNSYDHIEKAGVHYLRNMPGKDIFVAEAAGDYLKNSDSFAVKYEI